MDKYELVLDIIGHPEKYTTEELHAIMSDPETREIYNLLCMTSSTLNACKETDPDEEWKIFSEKHNAAPRRGLFRFGSRVASIAAVIGCSIVAVAAGIAVTVNVATDNNEHVDDTPAAVEASATASGREQISEPTDSVITERAAVMFEDDSLAVIMNMVAAIYGIDVEFNNNEAASLHLYYRLDPTLTLDEIVAQLNTFDQINISRSGNTLIIN